MSRTAFAGLIVVALTCVLAVQAATGSARASRQPAHVAQGFVGVVVDEPVWPDPYVSLPAQLEAMVAGGVQSLRVVFDWSQAQPYATWKQVPADERASFVSAGGVPTDFSSLDELVRDAAARGLRVLPTILDAPAWDGIKRKGGIVLIPRRDTPFAAFVKALVERYGPRGTLWAHGHGRAMPITMWQIWNEPNIYPFWSLLPFQNRYVALLRAARGAMLSVDPHAKLVLAGMPNYSWLDLEKIYRVHGSRGLFDVVAVHPYTRTPQGVITILRYVRQVMDRNGDAGKPLLADEISWPSSQGKTTHTTGYDFATTESGQANKIGALLPMLVRDRAALGLLGFYYYDWAGFERPKALAFDFSGLFRVQDGQFIAKPAYGVFRRDALAMEGCASKGQTASDCVT